MTSFDNFVPDNDFQNESIQVINEVKNTIASIIKDVISQEKEDSDEKRREEDKNIELIVQKIKEKVPDEVKIKTTKVDEKELQDKIKETVGKILTDDEINSIVQLRNISRVEPESVSQPIQTQVSPSDNEAITESTTNFATSNIPTISVISTKSSTNIASSASTTKSSVTSSTIKSSSTIQTSNPSTQASSAIVSSSKTEKDEYSNDLPEYNDKSNEIDDDEAQGRYF